MRLDELAAVYLEANQHTLRANTRRAYRADLQRFARTFPTLDTADLAADHLRAFLNASANHAAATLARRRVALRACFGWAYRNGFMVVDPSSHLDKISLPHRDPRPLSTDQVEALLAAMPARHLRNRLLFILLYETGIRVGEALGLHVQDVHLNAVDGGYIRVVGKGDRERIVPLIDAARSVRLLRTMTRKAHSLGPLFHGDVAKGGSYSAALDYSTVYYHFERYLAAARQTRPTVFADEPDPITIHRLRHTYATERLRAGVSLAAVRKLLGHQNVQTTLRYAEIDLETVKHELVEARRRATR
jgi:integrase/recombinase XerD